MAFSIVGLHMDDAALDAFEMVHALYKKKKGKMNIHDSCKIKAELQKKHGKRRVMYSMDLID